jgi:hypothetical protein
MSHTQAEIKRMIAKEKEDLKEILDGYKFLPEYQNATDEVKKLREQLTLAEKKQTEVIVDYKEEAKDDINFKREEMSYLQDMLDNMRNGLDVNDYNQELIDMFKKFHSVYTTSQNKKLHWVDEFGKFAIFKTLSSDGVPVAWYLYEIKEDFNDYQVKNDDDYIWRTEGGHWSKRRQKTAEEAMEGFLNKEFFLNLLEEIGWKKEWGRDNYRMEFKAPDYDDNIDYVREEEEGHEVWKENSNKKIYFNYLKIPTMDAEAFAMYPVLIKYK